MPNHVTNHLKFKGSKKDLTKLKKDVKSSGAVFSFNSFYPMPDELNITSPVKIVTEKEYAKFLKKKENGELEQYATIPITKAMQDEFLKKYGVDDWYNWRIYHWGTKWDCYSIISDNWNSDNEIEFQTAWSTPKSALIKLSELFPKVEISVRFYDEDIGNNIGEYVLLNGETISENNPDNIEDGLNLYLDITGDYYFVSDRFGELDFSDDEIDSFDLACINIACKKEMILHNIDIKKNVLEAIMQVAVENENFEYANELKIQIDKITEPLS